MKLFKRNSPALAGPNAVYGSSMDAKTCGNFLGLNSGVVELNYFSRYLHARFGGIVAFSSRIRSGLRMSALSKHIVNIVRIAPLPEMIRVYAARIIAFMKYEEAWRQLPVPFEETHPMGELLLRKAKVRNAHHSVPFVVRLSLPLPAFVGTGLFNFGPKSMIKHDVTMGDTHSRVKGVCYR